MLDVKMVNVPNDLMCVVVSKQERYRPLTK
jgi:hypothetical protein